ncbi:MAG: hypothetical protein ACE5GM_04975 [bacterium]
MGLAKQIIGKLAGNREVVREAVGLTGVDKDDWKYRKLRNERDLNSFTHERMLKIAYHLYETNPMAHRIIEMTKDFVLGDGISYQADDPRTKELLDDFWNDSVNHWDLKQHQKVLELGLYGEQCYPVFVNRLSGRVRLGYLDPLHIDRVETDPDNCEQARQVITKGSPGKKLQVIGLDEDPESPSCGRLVGDCFYFTVNKVSNATRGRSDLMALADWIDAYEQFLFNRLDRAALINAFVWDVKLEGMDEEGIRNWLKDNPAPKPGSIRAHNERITWNAVVPDLKGGDTSKEAHLIKNYILGGAGFPAHWFAEGGEINRATAKEMGEPTLKRLKTRQKQFKKMVEFMFRFVIDQGVMAHRIKPEADLSFEVFLPEIMTKNLAVMSEVLEKVTRTLDLALGKEMISVEKAAGVLQETLKIAGYSL